MLDDAFKLTIDVLFPKPEECYDEPELNFVVDDYDESENLWEYVYSHKRINTYIDSFLAIWRPIGR